MAPASLTGRRGFLLLFFGISRRSTCRWTGDGSDFGNSGHWACLTRLWGDQGVVTGVVVVVGGRVSIIIINDSRDSSSDGGETM